MSADLLAVTMPVYLWYCSLKNKVCHVCLCRVASVDGDDGDVGVRVCPLKREVYFQAVLVVGRHGRNTCRKFSDQEVFLNDHFKCGAEGKRDKRSLTCSCNVIKEGL